MKAVNAFTFLLSAILFLSLQPAHAKGSVQIFSVIAENQLTRADRDFIATLRTSQPVKSHAFVTVNQDGFQKVSDELFVGGRLVEIEKIKLTKEVPGSHKNTT